MEGGLDPGLLGADLSGRLEAWAAAARVDEAARARSRERWLRQAAEEGATFVGVLADLADNRDAVGLVTTDGRRHRGSVVALGDDFCALALDRGGQVLVRLKAIAAVHSAGVGATVAGDRTGDRPARPAVQLAEVLVGLSAEREQIVLRGPSGDALHGELRYVGTDVVALRIQGDPPGTCYVPLASIREVALPPPPLGGRQCPLAASG
jgi:hypothetical protein